MSRPMLALPAWIIDHVGYYFLLAVEPDGTAHVDGSHTLPSGVAKARDLYEMIHVIRPPAGTRYVMLTITEVPASAPGSINVDAVNTLNTNLHRPEKAAVDPSPTTVESE